MEGSCTEPTYFWDLATTLGIRSQLTIDNECGTDALSIVNHAIDLKTKQLALAASDVAVPFDHVWCVFDHEAVGKDPKLPNAVTKAIDHEINLAISNPAIEVWFLMHYGVTAPYADGQTALRALKKRNAAYKKGGFDVSSLRHLTADAIRTAERLRKDQNLTVGGRWPNPYTDVDLLVSGLVSMARASRRSPLGF